MLQHHIIFIDNIKAVDNTVDTPIITEKEDAVRNADEISKVAKLV